MTDSRKASIARMTGCVRILFTIRIHLGRSKGRFLSFSEVNNSCYRGIPARTSKGEVGMKISSSSRVVVSAHSSGIYSVMESLVRGMSLIVGVLQTRDAVPVNMWDGRWRRTFRVRRFRVVRRSLTCK